MMKCLRVLSFMPIVAALSGCQSYYHWLDKNEYGRQRAQPGEKYVAVDIYRDGRLTKRRRDGENIFSVISPEGNWYVSLLAKKAVSFRSSDFPHPADIVHVSLIFSMSSPDHARRMDSSDHYRVMREALEEESIFPVFNSVENLAKVIGGGFNERDTPKDYIFRDYSIKEISCLRSDFNRSVGTSQGKYSLSSAHSYITAITCPVWIDGHAGAISVHYSVRIYRELAEELGINIDDRRVIDQVERDIAPMLDSLEFYVPIDQPKMEHLSVPLEICYPLSPPSCGKRSIDEAALPYIDQYWR